MIRFFIINASEDWPEPEPQFVYGEIDEKMISIPLGESGIGSDFKLNTIEQIEDMIVKVGFFSNPFYLANIHTKKMGSLYTAMTGVTLSEIRKFGVDIVEMSPEAKALGEIIWSGYPKKIKKAIANSAWDA